MRPDRFTTLAQQAIAEAQSLASRRGHPELVGLHVLSALLEDASGPVASVLPRVGADVARLLTITHSEVDKLPTVEGAQPAGGRELNEIMTKADAAAREMKDAASF
ncbi:MAG: Clp protease N-terminal domain-containing protein, partial [Planctomycetota bacterium]